jgi:rare lipoprotein A
MTSFAEGQRLVGKALSFTGRSVTVRVNDRGPYVHGRVVDVTHSAAQALGMVGSGIAKVKLDVVE